MRVAVLSTTRDRLDYTKHCFSTLREKAGYPFDFYVFDNASEDGTQDWLRENEGDFAGIVYSPTNVGLRGSFIHMQDVFRGKDYDLIVTFDNDCEVVTDGILDRFVAVMSEVDPDEWILGARVEGLTHPPQRDDFFRLATEKAGMVYSNIGCIWMVRSARNFIERPVPEDSTLAFQTGDSLICKQHRREGGKAAVLEDCVVNHYETTEGQIKHYPEYWQRKLEENGWA